MLSLNFDNSLCAVFSGTFVFGVYDSYLSFVIRIDTPAFASLSSPWCVSSSYFFSRGKLIWGFLYYSSVFFAILVICGMFVTLPTVCTWLLIFSAHRCETWHSPMWGLSMKLSELQMQSLCGNGTRVHSNYFHNFRSFSDVTVNIIYILYIPASHYFP